MVAPTTPSSALTELVFTGPTAQSPPLPTLSPSNSALLLRLFTLNENYPALAAELTANTPPIPRAIEVAALGDFDAPGDPSPSAPPPAVPCPLSTVPSNLLQLYTWAARPEIAAWLTHHHQHQDAFSRRLAITKLESLIQSSPSEVEQRRAATTLLRALDHKWPAERRRAPVNPDGHGGARNPSPPSPSRSSPRHTPLPSALQELEALSATLGARVAATSSAPPAEVPSPSVPSPLPPFPAPSILPTLRYTPLDLAKALAKDLQQPDPCQAFATIRAISTEAFLEEDFEPILSRIELFLNLPPDVTFSDPEHSVPFEHEDGCRIQVTHPSHPYTLTLEFFKRHDEPWLLDLFETG